MARLTLISVVLLALPLSGSAQKTTTTEIAGRTVQMVLVKAEDLSPVSWDQTRFRLTQTSAKLMDRSNILITLREAGIAPDTEALTLVYDLNPAIRDLNGVSESQLLNLPVVVADTESKQLMKKGFLIELTVDPELRQQLNARIDSLQNLAPSIPEIAGESGTRKHISDTIDWFEQVERRFKRRTGPPLRRATLLQMNDEATQFESIVRGAAHQHRSLTDSERQQIDAIYEDMRVEISNYGQILADVIPGAQHFYSVTVIVKGAMGPLADGMRVYYTFAGLFRPLPADPPFQSFGFRELGSGKTEHLLMKNYQIWAAKDGEPNLPLTAPYLLRIDEASPNSLAVELSFLKRTEP
jgi:hypothetical protein